MISPKASIAGQLSEFKNVEAEVSELSEEIDDTDSEIEYDEPRLEFKNRSVPKDKRLSRVQSKDIVMGRWQILGTT